MIPRSPANRRNSEKISPAIFSRSAEYNAFASYDAVISRIADLNCGSTIVPTYLVPTVRWLYRRILTNDSTAPVVAAATATSAMLLRTRTHKGFIHAEGSRRWAANGGGSTPMAW